MERRSTMVARVCAAIQMSSCLVMSAFSCDVPTHREWLPLLFLVSGAVTVAFSQEKGR